MMRIRRLSEEPGTQETEEGSLGVNSIDVVLKREDIHAFSSRLLRIAPGGHTAYHDHPREHYAIVIRGRCRVETKDSTSEVREANVVTIPAGVPHRFFNPGNEGLALLIMNLFPPEPKTDQPMIP